MYYQYTANEDNMHADGFALHNCINTIIFKHKPGRKFGKLQLQLEYTGPFQGYNYISTALSLQSCHTFGKWLFKK